MSEADISCPGCGAGNPSRNRFCTECGHAFEIACPACGEMNPLRARFCGQCGQPMAPASASRGDDDPSPTRGPAEYTPHDLAERVLGSRASMEGERKQVTVLFADVVGSTALIRDLDAEAAVARLAPAVEAMMAAVHRHEGLVNRVQGDGIMALFGAPIAHEDHAARACLAAIEMRDAIAAFDDEALRVRVGLNSGEVVVRAIHNDLTMEYEADGPTVHLGARMEQLAEPGTVRATRRTFRLAEGYVEARALGALPVKGMDAPVHQVEIVRAVEAASRWEIRARRGLTRFVGRQAELGVLDQALALAAEGHGQVVALAGEPGMGKSRLLHEFLSARVPDDWTVRVTAASSDGSDTPYLPLRTLLRAVIGVDPAESSDAVTAKLDRFLTGLSTGLPGATPALRALIDVPASDPDWDALDPSQRRRRTIDAFRALTLQRAARAPLLLVFEDLHWIDGETQAALDALVESVPGARLMLIASYRPEYEDRWAGRSWHQRIPLGGLGASGADVLVGALLGEDPTVVPLRRLIAERTEGRPLFVEETVRALIETGELLGEPGAYRLADSIGDIQIPDSVQAVLAARMDRLEPETKRVLQTAAVIGRVVPLPLLERICGLSGDALGDQVAQLQAAEFLFERSVFPAPEYVFKHALTETVAYEGLLRARRVALHASVLAAMETLYAPGSDEHVEALGRHAFLGERWTEAVEYLRRAGRKATAQSAYPEAYRQLELALDALSHRPDDAERAIAGVDIRLELRPSLGAIGHYPDILTRLEEAEALAESAGDEARLLQVRADEIHVLYHLGHGTRAIAVGERAVTAAHAAGDRRAIVQTTANLGHAHFWRGDFRRALEIAEPFAPELEGPMRHERIGTTATSSCLWLGNLCGMHAMRGEFTNAFRYGETARTIAAETGRPFDLAISGSWHGFALLKRGELDVAGEFLDTAYDIACENEIDFMRGWIGALKGAALIELGAIDAARSLLADIHVLCERLGLVTMGLWARLYLAEALLAGGERAAACRHASEALELVQSTGFGWAEPAALRCLARTSTPSGTPRPDEPAAMLRQVLALYRAQDARPDLARASFELGQALAAGGSRDPARELLTAARDGFRSLGMKRWIPRAETAISTME